MADDDLTFDLKRRIERDTKEEEIMKAKRAIRKKKERGDDLGRPKFGYTYNTEKTAQVPGDDFQTALRVIQLRDIGATYREIEDTTGVGQGTIANILSRRDEYMADADEYDVVFPPESGKLRQ